MYGFKSVTTVEKTLTGLIKHSTHKKSQFIQNYPQSITTAAKNKQYWRRNQTVRVKANHYWVTVILN